MPQNFADLEIGLHRHSADAYAVEFRFSQPNSDTDNRLVQNAEGRPVLAQFALAELAQLVVDPAAYGKALTRSLFADQACQVAFSQAKTNAQALDAALRVRLFIGPSASELHNLYWETLCDPLDGSSLGKNENILFSRFLSSLDWRPVRMRSKTELSALAAIASPSDLGDYGLAEVQVEDELKRVSESLGTITCTRLPEGEKRVTLNNLFACLRDDACDILYLMCHGILKGGESWLFLEDDAGKVARVPGSELINRIKGLPQPPRLVVLASCQSAGSPSGDVLSALGPQLAGGGIPSVIAMQGSISIETLEKFLPAFFDDLRRDGQVDRAMASARRAISGRPDDWMPALFMRLKSGRLWYVPGFGEGQEDFEKWESLKGFILEKTCTPIIGPGLTELWLGQQSEIALRWAEKHNFPFSPFEQENLPRISQYIVRRDGPAYLRLAFRAAVRDELVRRYRDLLPEDLLKAAAWSPDQVLKGLDLAADKSWASGGIEAHRQLAELRLPVYITTSPGNLLAHALTKIGAQPVERLCPWWSNWIPETRWRYDDEPTPEKPLIYYLFGHISVPESLVISEDNYFDFLIGVTRSKELIPEVVRARLTSTALLFLGFGVDDWSFRILFRTLMAQEGSDQLKFYSHVAAQLEPDGTRWLDPRRARRYLDRYFAGEKISIFWGQPDEFLKELAQHMAS